MVKTNMIKVQLKKYIVFLIAAAILFSSSVISNAAGVIPDTVRVGLYFKDSSVNTAQSIFDVSAKSGVLIGFLKNDRFEEILKVPDSSTVFVRKDTYYYNAGEGLKEFEPSSVKPSGTVYGPYHIKIGSNLSDASSAGAKAASYQKAGIKAYVAYDDAWQVWAGSYQNEEEAKTDIVNYKKVVSDAELSVVAPASGRIVASDSNHKILCIFGSSSAYFQIRPAPENNPNVINIKGDPYRGAVEVRRLSNSDMTVINVVSMQEYLYGNVPPEIGGNSPAEALKAQAIASKMYVINNMGKHGKTGFDVCATTGCQVYKGYKVEVPACNKAIDEVKDKIITYNGSPAKHIYYFASGGGSTEDVSNVWGSSYPYLVSVEDKYEKIYTWTKTLRASDVKAILPQLGNILGISIVRTANTGRVTQLAVRGADREEPMYFTNEKCRTVFGLNSQLYTITTDADVYVSAYAAPDTKSGTQEGAENNSVSNGTSANDTGSNGSAASKAASNETAAKENAANKGSESKTEEKEAGSATDKAETVKAPVSNITVPVKTQLGGNKVITASGVKTLGGSNKKITILGANEKVNKVPMIPETYTFSGKGWGHAVGMSQEGAIGMAKAGMTYEQILTHYFQGTKVE